MSSEQTERDRELVRQYNAQRLAGGGDQPTDSRQAYSSVEVTRGQRGTYGWTVKLYVPAGEEDGLVDQVVALEALLRARFGDTHENEETTHD